MPLALIEVGVVEVRAGPRVGELVRRLVVRREDGADAARGERGVRAQHEIRAVRARDVLGVEALDVVVHAHAVEDVEPVGRV
jgi:hypothetical protein